MFLMWNELLTCLLTYLLTFRLKSGLVFVYGQINLTGPTCLAYIFVKCQTPSKRQTDKETRPFVRLSVASAGEEGGGARREAS